MTGLMNIEVVSVGLAKIVSHFVEDRLRENDGNCWLGAEWALYLVCTDG